MAFVTEQLAEFVGSMQSAQVMGDVVEKTERAVLDTLASLIAGVATENATRSRTSAFDCFGPGTARCWFSKTELHPLGALFANCAAASSLDIDDGHCLAAGHPGAAIVPAVLMEAARLGRDGKAVLTAIALGYDVGLRIAAARHFTGTMSFASGQWTGFGVAAAIGWLRGLPRAELAHAMAIAGAEAPRNLPQGDCQASSVKGSSPWSTVTALFALERASCGLSGPLDLLDRPHVYDIPALTAELGQRWLIAETYLKPYASCRYTHPVIDGVLMLVAGHGRGAPISRIEIDLFPEARKLPNETAPASLEGAQFSVPFTAALAALRGSEAFRPLQPQSLTDGEVLSLARKVDVRYPSEFAGIFPGRTPARVSITFAHGRFSVDIPRPLGDAKNPMDQASLNSKLNDLSRGVLSPENCERLVQSVAMLKTGNLAPLLDCLKA